MAHFFNSILPMFKSSYWYSSKTCLLITFGNSWIHKGLLLVFFKARACKRINMFHQERITKDKRYLHRILNWKNSRQLRREKKHEIGRKFQAYVKKAFIDWAIYMQQKFPLSNKLLTSLAGFDSEAIGHSCVYACLKRLSKFFPTILTELG